MFSKKSDYFLEFKSIVVEGFGEKFELNFVGVRGISASKIKGEFAGDPRYDCYPDSFGLAVFRFS